MLNRMKTKTWSLKSSASIGKRARSFRNSFWKSSSSGGLFEDEDSFIAEESEEDGASSSSISSEELARKTYYAIYLQRCYRYYIATRKWRWLKQQAMSQHRLALQLFHESELRDLDQAMHLYKVMRSTYLQEKQIYKRDITKLQIALDYQLEKEQDFYTDEIVWLTSKFHTKQDDMLQKLKAKLSNPKRAQEWIVKLQQGFTFEDMVNEINSSADPTKNDYRNPNSKRKRVLTFCKGDGKGNALLREDLVRRKDHGAEFDTVYNCMTYNQDLDLHLTNEYCNELKRMREQLDPQIKQIEQKRKKAIRGIQDRYSNRFQLSHLYSMHPSN